MLSVTNFHGLCDHVTDHSARPKLVAVQLPNKHTLPTYLQCSCRMCVTVHVQSIDVEYHHHLPQQCRLLVNYGRAEPIQALH